MRRPNVFTIPSGTPFLPTLARAILNGRFGAIGSDPLALADVTILLPTRRAARALRDVLVDRSPDHSAILPRIRPIGDVDEEDQLLAPPDETSTEALTLPPAISRFDRLLTLTRLIMAWSGATRMTPLPSETQDLIPSSAADAIRLAGDLARLIDDMQTAGIAWDALARLVPDEHAGYWQMTLEFLKIAGEQWPAFLTEQGRADPASRRDQLIRQAADRLTRTPPSGPIIAAGSTGSIPATAALLKTIANLPNGAVVLPGLDRHLDEIAWEAIGDPADAASGAPSHPQFGMKRLIFDIGILRQDVEELASASSASMERTALIGRALRPARVTDSWAQDEPPEPHVTAGIDVVEARNEHDEALAIALVFREALETSGKTAALITPDRQLAQRVAVELRRWNVKIDDSAGQPLDGAAKGIFVRLAAEAALNADVTALLAFAKHPLARFGMTRGKCRRAAKLLEIALLRGPGAAGTIRSLSQRLGNLRFSIDMRAAGRVARSRSRLSKSDWSQAEELARRLERALGSLEALSERKTVPIADLAETLRDALMEAAAENHAGQSELWADRDGDAVGDVLSGLAGAEHLEIPPREFPGFLAASLSNVTIAPAPAVDPRIHIWGTLEARLQSVDLLILGGLDEGVWPAQTRTDPWLSRRMREELGLPPPERRIGLSAHDFAEAMACKRVIVTRADRRGGSPTVASRWLQRLFTVAGEGRSHEMRERGARTLELARRLDAVAPSDVRPVARPAPTPPIEARPTRLSVTSIETLIRDPYAVYARSVLQLEALEPIGQRADARIRGSLIHESFADFTAEWKTPFDHFARQRFLELWHGHFEQIAAYPEVHAVWLLRAEPIADWLIAWEAGRDPDVAARYAERPGDLTLDIDGEPFKLTGRADRIDIFGDGSIGIYDYKTGIVATPKQVLLFQPQLALEGAMAQLGAFGKEFQDRSVAELVWIGLARIGKGEVLSSAVDADLTAETVSTEALSRLRRLIAAYRDPTKGYVSQARPMFERRFPGDFDHLARLSEWRYAIGSAE